MNPVKLQLCKSGIGMSRMILNKIHFTCTFLEMLVVYLNLANKIPRHEHHFSY